MLQPQPNSLMRIVSPCWRPSSTDDDGGGDDGSRSCGRADGLLWYKDLGRHAAGEFSMAVVQANNLLEDSSQIESGPLNLETSRSSGNSCCGTFVGVYDGHGGPETSRYIADHLFRHLKSM